MSGPAAVLIGPPGAGKTTIGERLADRLGLEFLDIDADIVAQEGKPITEIFAEHGEAYFRELEERAIAAALENHGGVLALGGGAVCTNATRQRLTAHAVVFLNVSLDEGVRRTSGSTVRPLLHGQVDPKRRFAELLEQRLPLYREVASLELNTDQQEPAALAEAAAEQLAEIGAKR